MEQGPAIGEEQQLPTWVETKTADNKVYYYNSTTRETSWKRPENVRIVKYEQMMAAAAMASAMAASVGAVRYPPMMIAGSIPPANLNPQHHLNHHHHPHPHHHVSSAPIMPTPMMAAAAGLPPPTAMMTSMPPAAVMNPYVAAAAAAAAAASINTTTSSLSSSSVSTSVVAPMTTTTPATTTLTSGASPASSFLGGTPVLSSASPASVGGSATLGGETSAPIEGKPAALASTSATNGTTTTNGQKQVQATATTTTSQQPLQKQQKDAGMRPVSTTPIPGTPWCVVWTDKNKIFYFNPSTKTSIWDRPPELRNREDVDKIISNPPPIKAAGGQASGSVQQQQQTESKTNGSNDDGDNDSSTSDQAEKKVKLDLDNNSNSGSATTTTSATINQQSTANTANLKVGLAPKIVKKEVASEIEKEAAKKRETIPFEERVETFRQMLEEKEVNPSSTFQKELNKIVFDSRYLLLTSNERRETFEKYCLEKNEEERKRKREKMKKAAESFKELLSEANLNSRSIYDDFHDKYSRDPRYRALERTKDREILFDDHLAMLRRKEREERSQSKRSERHHVKRKQAIAEENFRQLLRETKLIDKNTRRKIEESEHQHLIDIIGTLQNHRRYLDLEPYSEQRRKILLSYIEELAASNQ